ncbi:MAG: hypothetical protein M3R44_05445 [Candidatus Eremiobacteraeota bacterium]|nr:hypothetical protein [Candidatus Eremiobacteraeota bacterium]
MNRLDFLALSGASAAAAAMPLGDAQSAGGRTYFPSFPSAPFPDASRAAGHDYQGKHYAVAGHYDDGTVGIFVPDNLRPVGGAIDYIAHFHGWNNDVRTVLTRYRLREQVVASGRNAVLLVPQGPKDVPDSGDGKLELQANGFARLMHDVAARLHADGLVPSDRIGHVVLSAHSGGYGGAGGVLTRGGMNDQISDVLLFDAAYGYYDAFTDWAKASPQHHLLSLFTDDTSTGNAALMGGVQAAQPNIYVRSADTMTLAQLQTRAPTFVLTTSVAHDELLQKLNWYALFLQTTALTETRSA